MSVEAIADRAEHYEIELLDRSDVRLYDAASWYDNEHAGVVSAKIDYTIFKPIRSAGNLTIELPEQINWRQRRLKLIAVNDDTGHRESLGVFLPVSPKTTYTEFGVRVTLQLFDKLRVLQRSLIRRPLAFPVGTKVTDQVRRVIADAGESNVAITDSAETLKAPLFFPIGTSRLKVVNALLDAIGYWSVSVDGDGQYRAEPYQAPSARPERWTFTDDRDGIYEPNFEVSQDDYDVPNVIIMVQRTSGQAGEADPLFSVWENNDPNSPYSIPNVGEIGEFIDGVDATSQAVLDAKAARAGEERIQVVQEVMLSHEYVPFIKLNDAVRFQNSTAELNARYTLSEYTITLEEKGFISMDSTFRRVLVNGS